MKSSDFEKKIYEYMFMCVRVCGMGTEYVIAWLGKNVCVSELVTE